MLTVKKCWGIMAQGEPSAEYSWFPGYTWQIINCADCWTHLGWEFCATREDLRPKQFYGLTKTAIRDSEVDLDSDQDSDDSSDDDDLNEALQELDHVIWSSRA